MPTTPPSNLPTEPADMFGEVEKDIAPAAPNALKSGMLKPAQSHGGGPAQPARAEVMPRLDSVDQMGEKPNIGKIVFGIFILVLVGAIGYGGWFLWGKFGASILSNPRLGGVGVGSPPPASNPTTTVGVGNQSANILFGDVDEDGDGLSNDEEKALGSEQKNPDTDGDGLSDGDESRIWHTDALKKDSDSDGFNDGDEIKSGYDPRVKGGILMNAPLLVVRFVSNTPAGTSTVNYETFAIKTR